MGEDRRLAAFEGAYGSFVACIASLPADRFLARMESGTPRDVVARLIGWNRLTIQGCLALAEGQSPPYHADFAGEYRRTNAELVAAEPSSDRALLLGTLEKTKAEVVRHLQGIPADLWNADRGVRHPDGGPATIRRCLEELTRDYLDATDDITIWLESAAG